MGEAEVNDFKLKWQCNTTMEAVNLLVIVDLGYFCRFQILVIYVDLPEFCATAIDYLDHLVTTIDFSFLI